MNISNQAQSVPDAVKQVFDGYLPFGSEYVMFCDSYSAGSASYTCLFRRVGSDVLSSVRVYRSNSGEWQVSSVSSLGDYDSLTVEKPYYSISNIEGQGRYTVSPSGQNLVVLMLVICACLMILRTVFGGVKMCVAKSAP